MRPRLLISLSIYAFGTSSLLVSDFIVSGFSSKNDIAAWAQFRATLGLSAILCLIGLDQMMMRTPASSRRLFGVATIQVPFVAALLSAALSTIYDNLSIFSALAIALSAATIMLISQFHRSCGRLVAAQFFDQAWKVACFAGLIIVALFNLEVEAARIAVYMLIIGAILSAVGLSPYLRDFRENPDTMPMGEIYRHSIRYFMMSVNLAAATYLEIIILSAASDPETVAHYFSHYTYFVLPFVGIVGFFAFIAGPWIRDNEKTFLIFLRKYFPMLLVIVLIFVGGFGALGVALWNFSPPLNASIDPALFIAFLFVVFFRTIYVIPSAYVGVFGVRSEHDTLILLQVGSLGFALIVGFVSFDLGASSQHAIAFAGGVNWCLRTSAGVLMIGKISRHRSAK